MTAAPPKNAIQQRVDQLAETWQEFTDNQDARLLRLLIDSDSARVVDLFLELQNEEVGEIPDLFVRFPVPFEDPDRHGFLLRDFLIAEYDEIREGIAEEGIDAQWAPPEISRDDTNITAFARTCVSLRKYYEGMMVHFAGVLSPLQVSDAEAWQSWLGQLLQSDLPPNLRFLVLDQAMHPLLDALGEAHPDRMVTVRPDLDMPGAYAELVRAIPGTGPGFTFRRLFVALSSAASTGNLPAARQAAERAIKIATEQRWQQMQTVVHMTLAAAYFAAGDLVATRNCYRSANQAIAGSEDPTAPKLDIQTRFAEASVPVAEQNYEEAAQLYLQIVPLAEAQQDHFALLESCRMAAFCQQAAGRYEEAWETGHKALDVGTLLDEETRATSTLPYVGQGLLQLVDDGRVEGDEAEVQRRMVELLGEDWETRLEREAAPS